MSNSSPLGKLFLANGTIVLKTEMAVVKECFELLGPIAISFAHDSWFITHHHLASSLSKLSSSQVYGSINLGSLLYKNPSAQFSYAIESSAELQGTVGSIISCIGISIN